MKNAAATAAAVVPLRARFTALAGALILSPDTMFMRLTKFESRDSLSQTMGMAFYRGLGRLLFLPPLWLILNGKRPEAFLAASKSLGLKRLLLGMALFMVRRGANEWTNGPINGPVDQRGRIGGLGVKFFVEYTHSFARSLQVLLDNFTLMHLCTRALMQNLLDAVVSLRWR